MYRLMSRHLVPMLIGTIIATSGLVGCGTGTPLPPPQADAAASERDRQVFVDAMKPRRAGKPVIAVLALNEATETTDFLVSHAVLQRSGIAEVHAVAPRRGKVELYPSLQVEVAEDLAGFDRTFPAGADYVIVPAMDDTDNPAVITWLRQQADKGARVIGICAGGLVVGRAGLLDGRRFASHWYYRNTLVERHPTGTYVPNQRYVVDRDVATTTGISASVPATLALVEAIGGRDTAQGLAAELGVPAWTPAHDSRPFYLDASRRVSYLLSKAAFWRNETWSVDVRDGIDDIALALATDAWTRTGHVSVESASASGPVKLRSGLVLIAQPAPADSPRLPLAPTLKPLQQLDRTLCEIAGRFGATRREWVMLELEYPGATMACT